MLRSLMRPGRLSVHARTKAVDLRLGYIKKEVSVMSTSPREVITRLYDLISGPADRERDWEEVRALFLPEARLYSELTLPDGTRQSGVWTVDAFCAEGAREYRKDGFCESEIAARVVQFGHIAHVWSTYQTRVGRPDATPILRGINNVQLLQREARWLITSLTFQIEHGSARLPNEFLGATPDSAV